MKYFYYSLGLLLALAPNIIFSLTLKHWPAPWEDHTAFAKTLMSIGAAEAGISQLQEAVQLDPGETQHINLGVALTLAGHLPEAAIQFREALALNPQNVEAHSDLGLVLVMENQAREGITELKEALRIDPHDERTRWRLGSALLQQGQKEQGLEQFQQVVQDDPDNPEGHFYLGNILLETGRTKDAIDQYEEALRLSPGNEALQDNLNKALATLQNGKAK